MKLAVVATVWSPLSHADVIITRWVRPFPTDARCGWVGPHSQIASAHVLQKPPNDIGSAFCAEHGILWADSVAKALTLGEDQLAVDGVLLIGEHGDFPLNEYRQKLYPRKGLFDAIVEVFRSTGRTVPVFNDKHFSWNFAESCKMLETARQMGFPLYGGSSLPHCPTVPELNLAEQEVTEAVALFHGSLEAYGYHSMEFVQALIEVRHRGERGIRRVRSLEGEAARRLVLSGEIPLELMRHALVNQGYPDEEEIIPFIMHRVEGIVIFQIEYLDGLIVSHLLLPKLVSNWAVSICLKSNEIRTCQVNLGCGGPDFFRNFAYLNVKLESFFQTGIAPSPPLRTHLVTGILEASLHALKSAGQWMNTPALAIAY